MNKSSAHSIIDGLQCPIPISDYPHVLLAHGGGGKLMHQLIEKMFVAAFGDERPGPLHDGAMLELEGSSLAFTTDSYVVDPLFFPGGDIGSLAVCGTVNDLAMCGARPLYLSAGFILEEGLPMDTLWKVVQSMKRAADAAGVKIVTGDTKVVDKGKGDGVFINTAGVGRPVAKHPVGPDQIRPGDAVLVSGDIGRHGMAILTRREGLKFETTIASDCAPLHELVLSLLEEEIEVRCLRDLTRGGLATALIEIAQSAGREVIIEERAVPVREDVRGACEILGFDPMYVACEGRFIAFVPEREAEQALKALRRQAGGAGAVRIGTVGNSPEGRVVLNSRIGAARLLDMLSGEQLPRIC